MMESMKLPRDKGRELWIDYIKGMCMVGIIMFHINPSLGYSPYLVSWFLAGFFFTGGYTFRLYGNLKEFFIRKLRYLVVPVFSFGILNLLLSLVAKNISVIKRIEGIFLQLPGRDDDMWFVACLFVMEMIFYVIVRYIKDSRSRIFACFVLLAAGWCWKDYMDIPLPWHLVTACMMIIFVCLGYEAKRADLYSRLKKFVVKRSGKSIAAGLLLIYLLSAWRWDNVVDIHLLNYGKTIYFYLLALISLPVLFMICVMLERVSESLFCKSIKYIGVNSLAYYGMQSKVITIVITAGMYIGLSASTVPMVIVYTFIVLLILAPLSYFINRFMPFMLGRAYKKK